MTSVSFAAEASIEIGLCMILALPELLLWCNIETKCANEIKVDPIVLREEVAEPLCVEIMHPEQELAHICDEVGIAAYVLERSTETRHHVLGSSPRSEHAVPGRNLQVHAALRHRGNVRIFRGTFVRCYCENAYLVGLDHWPHRSDDVEIDIDVAARKRDRALAAAAEWHVHDVELGLIHECGRENVSGASRIDPHA